LETIKLKKHHPMLLKNKVIRLLDCIKKLLRFGRELT